MTSPLRNSISISKYLQLIGMHFFSSPHINPFNCITLFNWDTEGFKGHCIPVLVFLSRWWQTAGPSAPAMTSVRSSALPLTSVLKMDIYSAYVKHPTQMETLVITHIHKSKYAHTGGATHATPNTQDLCYTRTVVFCCPFKHLFSSTPSVIRFLLPLQ